MNTLAPNTQASQKPSRRQKGFALIATVSIMALLVLIVVGMLALSTSETKKAKQSEHQLIAQANARMALTIAIGQLQESVGPDQRVTANADIVFPASANSKWVGVWSTTALNDSTKPMVGANTDLSAPNPETTEPNVKYLTDRRNLDPNLVNGGWKEQLRLAWLVSGDIDPTTQPSTVPNTATTPQIVLVEKSAGVIPAAADPENRRVTAPYVEIAPSPQNNGGGYAYWVGDESQKARIDQKLTNEAPDPSNPTNGGMARLAGTEGPNFRNVQSGSEAPYGDVQDMDTDERSKLLSLDSVAIPLSDPLLIKNNFHDITTYSSSVLADAREGGLKKDLTAYINTAGTGPNPVTVGGATIQETGLAATNPAFPGRPMLPGNLYEQYGPNYLQLRKWYTQRSNVVSGSMAPVFTTPRNSTMGAGDLPDIKQREQPVHPVIAEARMAIDFSRDPRASGSALRLHVYPKIKLWNPYNVTIRSHRYVVGFPRGIEFSGLDVATISGRPVTPSSYYDSIAGTSLHFTLEAVDIPPGQCLTFSPQTPGESAQYNRTDISANILSPRIPNSTNNFYIDTDVRITSALIAGARNDYRPRISRVTPHPNFHYFLKDAGNGTGSIPPATAQTLPIIQKLAMGGNGDSSSMTLATPFPNFSNDSSSRSVGLVTSGSHTGVLPLHDWYMGARLLRLNENPDEQYGGYAGAVPGGHPIRKPILSGFNIRSLVMHRSSFDTQYDWVWWTVGPYINTRADQDIMDSSMNSVRDSVNGNYLSSPFGISSDFTSVKNYTMFDVAQPGMPLFSLASLQHAQLSYQAWQPSYIVANSFADPRSARDATVNPIYYENNTTTDPWDSEFKIRRGPGSWHDLIQRQPGSTSRELLIYDIAYATNHALWDRFFLSSIPYNTSGDVTWDPETEQLPNARISLNPHSSLPISQRTALLNGSSGSQHTFDYAANFLMNQGAFNINSTSKEAWRAFFSSMNDLPRPTQEGQEIQAAFSRLLTPATEAVVLGRGSVGAWSSARELTEAEIDLMAENMVQIVRQRGPFLGLSDFINRRLTLETDNLLASDSSLCGALQATIETSGINNTSNLQIPNLSEDSVDVNDNSGGWWSFDPAHRNYRGDSQAFGQWKTQYMPGYLTQADILQSIGSNITARGDTFVVRAYGDAKDSNGKVVAKAWCEAIVQRTPDYVSAKPITAASDPTGNNPLEPVILRNSNDYTLSQNSELLPINQKLGRKLVITQFRWLSHSEI